MHTIIHPAVPISITSLSVRFSAAQQAMGFAASGAGSSGAWPSAGLAIYIPLTLPFAYPVKRAFWANGGTSNGNVDLGIFDRRTKTKLFSTGAVGQGTVSVLQYVSEDWLILPGDYYMGLALSSGTGTITRLSAWTAQTMRNVGCLQEASAEPLPTTMTPALIGQAYWPLFGLTRMSSF